MLQMVLYIGFVRMTNLENLMNKFYDNNANNIEYFDIHNHNPKIEVKKKREDIREFSDAQLAEKLDDVEIKLQGLSEMYKATDNQETLTTISKLTSFKTAIRIEMRNRKIESYSKLNARVAILEGELKNKPIVNNQNNDAELLKKIEHSEKVINSLQGEVKSGKDKIKELGAQIEGLKLVISENKEAEKTKRHELNVKHDKYVVTYLLEYIKNTVSELEYQEVIEDMNEIREKNK